MIFNRHWITPIFVGCCCGFAVAEETPAGASGAGASSSFGSGVFSSGSATGATPSRGGAGGRAFSLFGSSEGSGAAASGASPANTQPAAQYTLPGFYGQGGQTFTAGEGLLARPRYETTVSLSMGYDDNYNQGAGGGDFFRVLNGVDLVGGIQGGQPIIEERDVILASGLIERRKVVVGFTEGVAPTQVPRFSLIPPEKRKGSLITKASFGFNMHLATRRSLLTFTASGGTSYYWDKDKDPFENNANIGANYLYRVTPRLQFTAALNTAYITQPDLSRANTPDRPTMGPYYNTLTRADLAYRFTPRFSLTGSLSYDTLRYVDSAEAGGDYDSATAGMEARYLWSPRYTFLTEFRHTMTAYAQNSVRDSTTDFLLIGTEFTINRRLTGSLRLGESIRSFDTGGSAASPHVESALSYRTTARSQLQWTNRFGFEEPGAADQEKLVLRSGITYAYSFTPRLRGTVSVNLLHDTTSSRSGGSEDASQNTFDSNFGLDYTVSQDFSLNLNYSFTDVVSNQQNASYYRNRLFFGGDYHF